MGEFVTVLSIMLAVLMLGLPPAHAGQAGASYGAADGGTGDSGAVNGATSGNAIGADKSVNTGTESTLTVSPPSYGRFLNESSISGVPGSSDSPSASPRMDSSQPASPIPPSRK